MKGNMYEANLANTWELFDAHLRGSRQALLCVISHRQLNEEAQLALINSAEQFGYGKNACTFLSLQAVSDNQDNPGFVSELDAGAVFMAVEGLDPLCIVVSDAQAARVMQVAYRCDVRTQASNRIMGRTAVAFVDFPRMLKSAQDKQRAWALLKQLPRCGDVQ